MARVVKELSDMQIDEISLVSRPANAHARVVIAKSEEGEVPDVFNSEGQLLDADDVGLGDVVYGSDGDPFVVVEDDHSEDLVGIGKADDEEGEEDKKKNPFAQFAEKKKKKKDAESSDEEEEEEEPEVKKSFAEELREELSKAYTDTDRDAAISKAMDEVSKMNEQLEEAQMIAKSERDLRLEAEYEEVAKSYNIPVDAAELAPVLRDIAEYLPYSHGEVIHKALLSAGEMAFQEMGAEGYATNNDVLNEVEHFIDQNVSKSDNISKAEAVEAVFDSNPEAYDEYQATRYNV